MGWAHQTYAEFLAARYLLQRNMTPAQIMSLIVHPDDADRNSFPNSTRLCVAGRNDAASISEIMKTDPEVLLEVMSALLIYRIALL